MKAWLKGGLIGILIFIAFIILPSFFELGFIGELSNMLFNIFLFQFTIVTQCSGESCMMAFLWVPIIAVIELFILGALIATIIQKLKQKKEKTHTNPNMNPRI